MLTSHRALRRLLFVTACAWGIASGTAGAAVLGEAETRKARIEFVPVAEGSRAVQADSRQGWMKIQWAGLSPEQREQMRNQVREHRQRSREEFRRDERRDARRAPPAEPSGARQQRLSPDEREEFRQWMRERQGGGRNGRGRGQ